MAEISSRALDTTRRIEPAQSDTVREQIRELARHQNCGILWTSHNMYEVEAVCDRVLVLFVFGVALGIFASAIVQRLGAGLGVAGLAHDRAAVALCRSARYSAEGTS